MERIGIYGGTFNPPHIGHIRAALGALGAFALDKLYVIPDRIAPHKVLPKGSASPQQRMDMLRLALDGEPNVILSDLELRREGKSYTYETVAQLRQMHPDAELVLLMGTDMFLSFRTWRNPERILADASLGVFYRGDKGEIASIDACKAEMEAAGHKIYLAQNAVVDISSTDLRRLLIFGCAAPFLPDGVEDYIRQNGLYGAAGNYRDLSMEQLEQVVIGLLAPKRIDHVLGCRDTCVELARHWGADETDAARAGLLHDITKAIDGPLQLTLCDAYGRILSDFSRKYPKTLHALTGSLVAERIFGENEAVVDAIACHTTGKADMTVLQKILYIADYMEPNRDFPGVDQLRELAYRDLDAAMRLGLTMTLEHLKSQGAEVSPESREALAWLNQL